MSLQGAFNDFMSSKDFEFSVDSSTRASWGGGSYSVELFEDGTYRVLGSSEIGNMYDSPGMIIGIPALGDDEWDDDPNIRFYGNAREYMKNAFHEAIAVNA